MVTHNLANAEKKGCSGFKSTNSADLAHFQPKQPHFPSNTNLNEASTSSVFTTKNLTAMKKKISRSVKPPDPVCMDPFIVKKLSKRISKCAGCRGDIFQAALGCNSILDKEYCFCRNEPYYFPNPITGCYEWEKKQSLLPLIERK
uniref:Uncharacterized protein n=1 Tax=Strigamia maritima TaxID=126957 RepID=T1J2W5_STRMM